MEHHSVRFLRGPAEILLDPWGVPHIYAGCREDAFFAQGFNAARDRLWQMDLWRRKGLGLLSEALGPGYVARDRAARLFLYRGPMDAEWAAYGCDLAPVIPPFVAGINEYVRLTEEVPELLPAEFRSLGYRPAAWQPQDVLRIRSHGFHRNIHSEVARAMILHEFGPEAEALRVLLEPDTGLVIPDGLDLSLITADVLGDYDLATTPAEMFHQGPAAAGGSNNWAISGRRTATGRPILANDPHRAVTVPSLRYLAHLVCPGLNVIGGGEPVLPGISIGHNGRLAFGFTILPVDQEDLYLYETDVPGGSRYRYGGGWEPMEVSTETVAVRGGEPVEVELKFTRHGPVVHEVARPGRVQRQGRLAAARHGALPGQRRPHAGGRLERVPRGGARLGGPGREPGLRGRGRQHRLAAGRACPGPPQLGWPAARPRRRPLRMGRVPHPGRPAHRGQPGARLAGHRQPAQRDRRPGGWGPSLLRMGAAVPVPADP